jgi:hypothetical protein
VPFLHFRDIVDRSGEWFTELLVSCLVEYPLLKVIRRIESCRVEVNSASGFARESSALQRNFLLAPNCAAQRGVGEP